VKPQTTDTGDDTGATNDRYWSHERQEIHIDTADHTGATGDRRLRLQQYHLLSRLVMAPVSSICRSLVAPASICYHLMIRGSGISCRSWLQYLLSFVAPVSCICCRSWLQYWFCHFVLWLQYHLLSPVSDVRGSSICRSWLRSPVSVDRGLWLQWWLLLLLLWFQYLLCVSPVPLAVACGSIGCRFWLQSPVSVVAPVSVVRNSSLQYLSVVWLRYLQYLSSRLVAPVSVVHGSTTSICCLWLSFVAPVAAMVVFLPMALTGSHLVFW